MNGRIEELRLRMKEVGVSACLIPTSDCHDSEYISEHFRVREYFSGFTGSAGTLVVGKEKAALFTDGRYFIQAQEELQGSGVELMKMGEPGVPSVEEFIMSIIDSGDSLGFDGRVVSASFGQKIQKMLKTKNVSINSSFDPAERIWKDRPSVPNEEVFILEEKYSGESSESKIRRIFEKMKEKEVDSHIITSLDDIAWIMNLRGNDIECNPVFLAYMVFCDREVYLYANIAKKEKAGKISQYVEKCGVILKDYEEFWEDGLQRVNNCTLNGLLYDSSRASFALFMALKDGLKVLDERNISTDFKAVKNEAEIENIKKANAVDGAAMVKFERWLRESLDKGLELTELGVQEKLEEFRRKGEGFVELSFETICAYKEHGAIIHYSATEDSNALIEGNGLLMIDSGAHYLNGTTDVTRTYSIGDVDEKLKHDYTLVLKASLRLLDFIFLSGACGCNLDTVVREVFWKEGLDFKHGTGHGIGYLLDVHEGPNSIRWKVSPNKEANVIYKEGMLTSDEPGLYVEGSHGIRIETDILCVPKFENEYGKFLGFEPVTFVPIDVSPILIEEMTDCEIEILNRYHALVRNKLSELLEGEDLEYLYRVTEPLHKG